MDNQAKWLEFLIDPNYYPGAHLTNCVSKINYDKNGEWLLIMNCSCHNLSYVFTELPTGTEFGEARGDKYTDLLEEIAMHGRPFEVRRLEFTDRVLFQIMNTDSMAALKKEVNSASSKQKNLFIALDTFNEVLKETV